MTYSQPMGYRMSSNVPLTSVSRALERFGWPLWRDEILQAVSSVAVELLASPDDRNDVYQRLSHGQVTESDLVMSVANDRGLLLRAAEFLDVGHAVMHRQSALPLPPQLDLRCRAQFMDDPSDERREWIYVLFGTERANLERVFLQLKGLEAYPLDLSEGTGSDTDPDREMRQAIWNRVLARYSRFSPLAISAPELQVTFDMAESLKYVDRDVEYAAEGKTTVTAAVAEVERHLGQDAPPDLFEQLTAPIRG